MKRYFSHGTSSVEYDFDSDEAAVAFGRKIARQMPFHGYEPGSTLEVCDESGEVIAEITLRMPLH